MKRRIWRFLLGILYVEVVTALLIVHIQGIAEPANRRMALLETLMLAVSAVFILILYMRVKDPPEKEADFENQPEITHVEQLREKLGGDCLTEREWEIAWLLYRGYSNRQIAEECCIAETTVKKHTSHIYEKLQVSGRKELKDKIKG